MKAKNALSEMMRHGTKQSLPPPVEFQSLMDSVSTLVKERARQLAEMAKAYGVHSDGFGISGYGFVVTRVKDDWGVYLRFGEGETKNIVEAGMDARLLFLAHADEIEADYVKKICQTYQHLLEAQKDRSAT